MINKMLNWKLMCGVGKKINTIVMQFMDDCLPITTNGWVFAFVAHADTSILADTSKGNDANALLP